MGVHNKNNLQAITLQNLPAFPDTVLALLEATRQQQADLAAIEEIVGRDVVLAARVLEVACTNQVNGPRRLASLRYLLEELGTDAIKTLAMSAAVQCVFSEAPWSDKINAQQFRLRTLRVAALCRALAEQTQYPVLGEAHLAGLLQGLGTLAVAAYFPTDLPQAIQPTGAGAVAADQVGEWLLRRTGVESFVADALLYYREPAEHLTAAHALVRLLHLAWRCATALEAGEAPPYADAAALCKLERDELDRAVAQAQVSQNDVRLPDLAGSANGEFAAARELLAREVRVNGLLANSRPNFSGFEASADVLVAIRKAVQILFGFRACAFLLFQSERNCLSGAPVPPQRALWGELEIPCIAGVSRVGDAMLQERSYSSFDQTNQLAVVDRELLALLNVDGFICVPMRTPGRSVGVMLLGGNAVEQARFAGNLRLIEVFAQQAAFALQRHSAARSGAAGPVSADLSAQARRIVHEASNPLAVIKNYVKILRMKMGRDDPAQLSLGIIDDEIDRVATIIRSLTKTDAASLAVREADVNAVVLEVIRLATQAPWHSRTTRVRSDLSHGIAPLAVDRDALKQVLLNLVRNASEAMQDAGGEIVIATRGDYMLSETRCLQIVVKDNGPGIPQAVLNRLFEPVSSVKEGEHAGVGLHIVHNLVQQMGGVIQCHSSGQRGTLFQIFIPQQQSSATLGGI